MFDLLKKYFLVLCICLLTLNTVNSEELSINQLTTSLPQFIKLGIDNFNHYQFKVASLEFELITALAPRESIYQRYYLSSLLFNGEFAHAFSEFLIVMGLAKSTDYLPAEINELTTKLKQLYLQLAVSAMHKSNWQDVIKFTQMYLVHSPNSLKAKRLLAFAYANLNNYDLAEKYYNICLTANPQDSSLRADFAYMLESMGDIHKAYEQIKEASKNAPNVTALYVDRAWLSEACKDYSAALDSIDEAIKLSPNSPGLWIHKGRILISSGKINEARIALLKVLQLEPDSIAAQASLKQISQNSKPVD